MKPIFAAALLTLGLAGCVWPAAAAEIETIEPYQQMRDKAMEVSRLAMALLGARTGVESLCGWPAHGDIKFVTDYFRTLPTQNMTLRSDLMKAFIATDLSAGKVSGDGPEKVQRFCDDQIVALNKKADDAKEMLLTVKQSLGFR